MHRQKRISLVFGTTLLAAAGMLLLLGVVSGPSPVRAGPLRQARRTAAATTRYVAISGSDDVATVPNLCTNPALPCRTVQHGVDVADPGDEILVATGVYTGVQIRGGVTQVVYVSETVSIQGGYTSTTWSHDPIFYPTTLDAAGQGRVIYVTPPVPGVGLISPTLEGLHITGGDATGLGGAWVSPVDAGGGVYVATATITINNCVINANTASTTREGLGGGLYFWNSSATLNDSTVQGNTASTTHQGRGGGLYFYQSDEATLSGNTVQSNTAGTAGDGSGGGIYLHTSDNATLSGNVVRGNVATTGGGGGVGGGLCLLESDHATLSGNTVQGNLVSIAASGSGGGIFLDESDHATLSGNTIVSNTTTLNHTVSDRGGGLAVRSNGPFTLTNNLVVGNRANIAGAGIWLGGPTGLPVVGSLLHTTIADNSGSGQGVFVDDHATLAFTNTIVSGHAVVGITVTAGSTVTLAGTLWHDNGSHVGGEGVIISSTNVYNAPLFANPTALDYHLTASSPAIDGGVDAGVTTDIDGDPRPIGRPDLGADEWGTRVYLPLVLRNHQ